MDKPHTHKASLQAYKHIYSLNFPWNYLLLSFLIPSKDSYI